MNFYAISALANLGANLFIGVLVLTRNRKNPQYVTFSLFCGAVAFWSLFYCLWQVASNASTALWMCRWLMVGAIWIPTFFFHYTMLLADGKMSHRPLLMASYFSSVVLTVGDLCTPLVVIKVVPRLGFEYWPVPGVLFHVHLAMFAFLVVYAVVLISRSIHHHRGVQRVQLKYSLIATVGGFGGGITNYFLWYHLPLKPIATLSVSFYTVVIAFAILRHQFMDIRLVLRDTTLHLFSAALLGFGCLAVTLPLVNVNPFLATIGSAVAMGVLMAFAYSPITRALQPAIDRLMFANRFGYLEELSQLPNDMLEFSNLREMLRFLATRLMEAARLDGVRILMYDPGHQSFVEALLDPDKRDQGRELSENSPIVDLIKAHGRLWTKVEMDSSSLDHMAEVSEQLVAMNAVACFPVKKADELLGIVFLGPKKSGEAFNQQDLKILRALQIRLENFLAQAMTITQEALNMVKDSHDMKNDVNAMKGRVTWRAMRSGGWWADFEKELQTAEAVARALPSQDPGADTLRLALSSIRQSSQLWYDDLKKSVPVEEGTLKRLAHRLKNWAEYGRVVSEGFRGHRQKEAVDIAEAARFSVERWRPMAEGKALALKADVSESLWVWGERSLVEQIVENLIDNAIKATAKGTIDVRTRSSGGEVQIEVKDSGCGIPEVDLPTIFERPFYQGKGREHLEQSTGVGLYLVAQYAKSLGGRVSADSRVGEGSTFRVILPVHRKESAREGVAA